jgi:hypothetical protein
VKLSLGSPFVVAIAAVCTFAASMTFAQGTGAEAPAGAAGRSVKRPSRQSLDFTVSSTAGYDVNADPQPGGSFLPGGQDAAGYSAMLGGTTEYRVRGRRLQLRATTASAMRYMRPLDSFLPAYFGNVSQAGAIGFVVRSRRTIVDVNQTGVYTSSPLYGLFPGSANVLAGDAPPVAPDYTYAINSLDVYSYNTAATLNNQMTARTALAVGADWQHTDAVALGGARRGLDMYRGRGQVSHHLARNTTAVGGYFYRVGDVDYGGVALRMVEHGAETGLDIVRPLSATRHLTFGVRVGGSSMLLPPLPGLPDATDRRYNTVSGQLSLAYDFSRQWVVRGSYRRGVDYVAGLSEPVSAESVTAGLDGALARRVTLLASAAYSNGMSALTRTTSAFDTYTGNLRLRFLLTRTFVVYAEDSYYLYDSRGSAPLVPGIPSRLERHGVRLGFTLSVPAL